MRIEDCEFNIITHPEHIPIRGNAVASGDDEFDKGCEKRIVAALERGDEWAWCTVEVRASLPDTPFAESEYLGCCSYDNEKHFREDGYFEDMKAEAFNRLETEVARVTKIIGGK